MKKNIVRNIAFITAIFMIVLSIMLISNYFQAKEVSPLQSQVIETLKELNEQNSDNLVLQEQIRQLDLMARRAFFLNTGQLMRGVYIILGMLVVFIICIRIYFSGHKNIPEKDLDPIDEWIIKTQARKYIGIAAASLAALAILFTALSIPFMGSQGVNNQENDSIQAVASANTSGEVDSASEEYSQADTTDVLTGDLSDEAGSEPSSTEGATEKGALPADAGEISKVSSNAFRGNNSNGHTQAKNVPVKWDLASRKNIAWKTEIPFKGQSSPIINGNKVFITGADDQTRSLFCYDLNTGKLIWKADAKDIPGSPASMPKTSADTGPASSSAATNGSQVCAIFANGDLIGTDMNGKILWKKNLGVPDNHYGYASSLIIFNNQLLIQYDNRNTHKLISINSSSGKENWSKDREDKITWSSPTLAFIDKKPVLVLMGNPNITAYDPNTGNQIWKVKCLTGEVGASACSYNNIVFGASEYSKMVALNGKDGSQLWEASDFLPEASSPVADANNVYIATSYGVVASYDTKTGEMKKQIETNEEFYSSPVMAEGKIFLISNSGTLFLFSTGNDFKLLDSFKTGEKTYATPAFTDNRIVVRTEKSIYCVKTN